MTVAVCLQCGELKLGAFNTCDQCGYSPSDDESLTKHLLVTDHYHSREMLDSIAAQIKSGAPIEFDPETLQAAWVSQAALDAKSKAFRRACWIAFALVLAIIVGVCVVIVL
jgi:hypothetical protein